MTVYQQDEVQWFTKPELAAYVQERVEQAHAGDQALFDTSRNALRRAAAPADPPKEKP